MIKNIARYYADTDIRCNAIAPGPTPMRSSLRVPRGEKRYGRHICARKWKRGPKAPDAARWWR